MSGDSDEGNLAERRYVVVVDLAPTAKQQRAGLVRSIEVRHREGMTAVKDPAINRPTWDAYRELLREGEFDRARLRIVVRGKHACLRSRRATSNGFKPDSYACRLAQ